MAKILQGVSSILVYFKWIAVEINVKETSLYQHPYYRIKKYLQIDSSHGDPKVLHHDFCIMAYPFSNEIVSRNLAAIEKMILRAYVQHAP